MANPTTTATKRVAIYARRSKDDGQKDVSIPEQIAECRKWAESRGHVVVATFQENKSGVTFDRPQFQAMLAGAKRRDFDAIVVLDVSRFSRGNVDEAGWARTELRRFNVEVAYVQEGAAFEGSSGPIMSAVAQHSANDHSVKTGFKVALGQAAALRRGGFGGGSPPMGYRVEKKQTTGRDSVPTLVIVEEEAVIVRRIFALCLRGLGHRGIARILNDDGIVTRKGRPWNRDGVRDIVNNPAYMGDLVRGKPRRGRGAAPSKRAKFFRIGESGPVSAQGNASAPVGIEVRDAIPAIVDRADWHRVQAGMDERATTIVSGQQARKSPDTPKTLKDRLGIGLLSGIARCGACGGPMQMSSWKGRGRKFKYYICSNGRDRKDAACKRVRVLVPRLEDTILRTVRETAQQVDAGALAAQLRSETTGVARESVIALEKKRRKIMERASRLAMQLDQDDESALEVMRTAKVEAERIDAEIERARKAEGDARDAEAVVAAALDAARNLDAPDTREGRVVLRDTLRKFITKLVVQPVARARARVPVAVEVEFLTMPGVALTVMWGIEGGGLLGHPLRCPQNETKTPLRRVVRFAV